MNRDQTPLAAILTAVAGYALMELYLALRPPDLTDRLHAWLDTTHGRFETFYAEWRQRAQPDDGAPLGD